MSLRRLGLTALAAAACCLATVARAQIATEDGWYLTVDAAPAWHERVTVQAKGAIAATQRLSFKTGARVPTAVGYRFNPWVAAELEPGFLYHSVWNSDRTGDAADLFRVPFMVNVIATWRDDRIVTPYAGVGVGGIASIFSGTQDFTGTGCRGLRST
jgi:opacity protein-like surface antigen